MRIRVTSDFWLGGLTQSVGTELDVDDRLGIELIANHRAERVVQAAADADDAPAADASTVKTRNRKPAS
jgi:hypothetical protein